MTADNGRQAMTLTEFLLARIAEDQEDAYQAQGLSGIVTAWHTVEKLRERGLTRADARHVARWSSARVLAECEAKRRIVGNLMRVCEDGRCGECGSETALDVRDAVLLTLALPYADHPDYLPEFP